MSSASSDITSFTSKAVIFHPRRSSRSFLSNFLFTPSLVLATSNTRSLKTPVLKTTVLTVSSLPLASKIVFASLPRWFFISSLTFLASIATLLSSSLSIRFSHISSFTRSAPTPSYLGRRFGAFLLRYLQAKPAPRTPNPNTPAPRIADSIDQSPTGCPALPLTSPSSSSRRELRTMHSIFPVPPSLAISSSPQTAKPRRDLLPI
mmetsp:Transcript_285/g.694  ORF Transcript_285/g.694 Transcript_285/m.694 type:complete len:205 (+) Transcript_285:1820-2434(+)